MARINLSFYDKDYTIEYNRAIVKKYLSNQQKLETLDPIDQVLALIEYGLEMHHKDDMPSRDVIFDWVMALGDSLAEFVEALKDLIQGAIASIEEDRKNLKWAKVEA